ncbi:hypothetical protein PROFUN_06231 [Planoprotostelium fungivorum]|uniref:Uncharacterized protein n=1 Tax=Planoprotostelium fungivorum TaxID=1890364 RepID=A0A2P6NE44_9EUKA|nr:hypothetical protein PROFUN_06231 [Planoprotostelium fungivorum]
MSRLQMLLILLFLLALNVSADWTSCTYQQYDLSSLKQSKDMSLQWGGANYLFNFCQDLQSELLCPKSCTACRYGGQGQPACLMTNSSITFSNLEPGVEGFEITSGYKSSGPAMPPTSLDVHIFVRCDPTQAAPGFINTTSQGYDARGFQLFYIWSPAGCLAPPKDESGGGGALGVGAILCIVFASVIAAYLIVGVAVKRVRTKEFGVPNKGLWVSTGGLIKDGFHFTYGKTRAILRREEYQTV